MNTKDMLKNMKLRGDYAKVTAWMKKKQIYTRSEVIAFLKSIGKSEGGASATATVMLSPRLASTRGDCRGNMSNPWGHIAYNDKFARKVKDGVKEEQRFRFRFRKDALEANTRYNKVEIEAKKVEAKASAPAPAPAKTKTPAKAKAKAKAK